MSTTEVIFTNSWEDHNGNTNKDKDTNISENLAAIARRELREEENVRTQCLAHLREWIKQNPDIENCITDDVFLLRFLRVKKFSIPMAQQVLLKYLNYRKKFKHIMYDLDYMDSKVHQLITNGYIFVSPFRDTNGRRVIIYDLGKFDLDKFNGTDMSRAHAITYETLMEDEENQILGVNHVADLGAVGPSFVTLFSVTEFAYLIRWGEQSFPMRHKEINLFNLPAPIKYIYDFAKSNLSQKLKERFAVHDCTDQLLTKIPKRCLPLELGGEIPSKEMVDMWKEELSAKRDRLLGFDAMNLLSDKGIIRSKNTPSQDDTGSGSLPGSFRKLELD
ncbi:alpha-tocopherol transfer protein-like [Anoplophora glabripennis]|uniref:alpha-tocopherol transfer protein-like n=1 Tax=Anoplophora glabripennis TaxID=217634 RepID=UPI00087477F9|nr:alpha-tocopherol transfer protein-like [Anoplophora glabripennis]XP_018569221.1 alpha-tocopherol transfer protein-like [Anoplophora glabripennis]XP_018569222.1 alpha-tocopherol transfer protein-like [Anoplophora glabripennis]